MTQVVAVFEVTGECDAIAWVACKDREEFSSVVKSILGLDGVKRTNTSVVLDIAKDPFTFVPDVL
jgi:DNA-binding Lrp family transcriptional regulator